MPCDSPSPPEMSIEDMNNSLDNDDIIEDDYDFVPVDESILFFGDHVDSVFCCNFNKNATLAVSGGKDDIAHVWDPSTGEEKFQCVDHKDSVIFAAFSPDDSLVASADMSGVIQACDVESGIKVWSFEVSDICFMQWHHNANVLFAATDDGALWKWSIPDGDTNFCQASGASITSAKLFPNSEHIVVGINDGTLRFFETKDFSPHKSVTGPTAHKDQITAIDCSNDNILIASGSADGTLKLIKSTSGKVLWTADCCMPEDRLNDECASIEAVAFCESLPTVASGTNSGHLAFWDLTTGTRRSFSRPTEHSIVKMIFASNSPLLYLCTSDNVIQLHDSRDGLLKRKWEGHVDAVLDFVLSRDETKLLSCSDDGSCRIFEIS